MLSPMLVWTEGTWSPFPLSLVSDHGLQLLDRDVGAAGYQHDPFASNLIADRFCPASDVAPACSTSVRVVAMMVTMAR